MKATNPILAKMESIISNIAGVSAEIAILGAARSYISIMMEGQQVAACERLAAFFGRNFDSYEYDEELDATYAGIELNK